MECRLGSLSTARNIDEFKCPPKVIRRAFLLKIPQI